jgi:hypothetical protein
MFFERVRVYSNNFLRSLEQTKITSAASVKRLKFTNKLQWDSRAKEPEVENISP